MSIQKILGINAIRGAQNVNGIKHTENNFVKNAFNFGAANPNRPNGVVYENALGDPTRGTRLYCLG